MTHSHEEMKARQAKQRGPAIAPLYAKRDIESLGDFYMKHLSAMTLEGLHDKSAIAAELAYRDRRIRNLERRLRHFFRSDARRPRHPPRDDEGRRRGVRGGEGGEDVNYKRCRPRRDTRSRDICSERPMGNAQHRPKVKIAGSIGEAIKAVANATLTRPLPPADDPDRLVDWKNDWGGCWNDDTDWAWPRDRLEQGEGEKSE